jgi:hypothetical protein
MSPTAIHVLRSTHDFVFRFLLSTTLWGRMGESKYTSMPAYAKSKANLFVLMLLMQLLLRHTIHITFTVSSQHGTISRKLAQAYSLWQIAANFKCLCICRSLWPPPPSPHTATGDVHNSLSKGGAKDMKGVGGGGPPVGIPRVIHTYYTWCLIKYGIYLPLS